MTPKHATPEDAIKSWFTDRTHLDGRDASDLIAHLYAAGWTFRRTDEIAIDRHDAKQVAEGPESAPQARVRTALEQQAAEPAPLSAVDAIQEANARWLGPHVHRGVPARLHTGASEQHVIVRLDDENRAEWSPAIADADEHAAQPCLFRFPVTVNTDSDTLGAIQILASKLVEAGHRYEIVNEPAGATAAASSGKGDKPH